MVTLERITFDAGDDLVLSVAKSGTGPPLMLFHGFTGSHATWSRATDSLSSRYTTFSVDLPGHGDSSSPADASRYALDVFAGDLAHLLDFLDLERVAVFGYSLGGRAALRFALRQPERLSALILESTSPGMTDQVEREARRTSDEALADMIDREGVETFVTFWERLPIWESQSSLDDETRAAIRAERMGNSATGLANSLRGAGAAADAAVIELLSGHEAPTLLVVGELDPKFIAYGRTMSVTMQQARLEVVASAGHAIHLEQPSELIRLVADFLDAIPSSGEAWL